MIPCVGVMLITGCTRTAPDPRVGPPLVSVATVRSRAPVPRAYTGVVSARVESNLGFRIPGKIVERMVDVGQAVYRGQPLMRLDSTDYVLAADARGSAVRAARAHALQTAADEKRSRTLLSAGATSASAYDMAKAAADSAAADLNAAVAELDEARRETAYSVLIADSDGVVTDTLAEPGQVVVAGQAVVRLAHSGPREAKINLPETFRPEIGSIAQARLYDRSEPASAKLRQIASEADSVTRTYEARYVLAGSAADAPLGATVTILIADPHGGSKTLVPWSALCDSGAGPGVWIVEGREPQVTWRPVKVVGLGEEAATLSVGLVPGERFVTAGAYLLHEGERVRVFAGRDWTQ